MNYRREIDGLRAIAVLSVIFFHAGFDSFHGGFVGVDIFFVISGYLIATTILTDLEGGRFSIADFYERRARRILPALFTVMLVAVPLSWFSLFPSEMRDFSQSLVAVSLFSSNFLFWFESGYFETASELKPLLHTWSLAVEEQFYLFFPLLMLVFWSRGRSWLNHLFFVIAAISFVVAQWLSDADPSAAFFLIPARIFELLIGSLAALYITNPGRRDLERSLAEIVGWTGVVLITFSILAFDKETPFPGVYALFPTFGTALVILFVNQGTTLGKIIGNKVFVSIGLVSYSAYLWHQPLFAYARHHGVYVSDAGPFSLLAFGIGVLSYLTWRFIETPFRNRVIVSRRGISLLGVVGVVFFSTLGAFGYKKNGDLGQVSTDQRQFLNYFENELPEWRYFTKHQILEKTRSECDFYDIPKYRAGSPTVVPRLRISESCFVRKNPDSKVVFIWGDSHAQQLYYGLSKSLPSNFEILQVASSGCMASVSEDKSAIKYCEHSNRFAFDAIKKNRPHVVIVGQNLGHDFMKMDRLAGALRGVGAERVIFTGPSPHWISSLPKVMARRLPNVPKRTYEGVDKNVLKADENLKSLSSGSRKFEYISLVDYFCDAHGCLTHYTADVPGSITSWDYGHLTPTASYHLGRDLLVPKILNQ
jgi:peptidoglycan/LPS O-acetylase OafA/YrhL